MRRRGFYISIGYIGNFSFLVVSGKMISFIVNINSLAFALVIVPVSITTILMNIFFVYCMFSSQKRTVNSVKPAFNVLLWSLIGCSLILNFFNLLFVLYDFVYPAPWLYIVSAAGILFSMRAGFTASLGLQVCYCLQIVPVQRPVLIWIKKHLRLLMYVGLFIDRLFFLFEFILHVVFEVQFSAMTFNSTSVYANITSETTDLGFHILITDFWLRCGYFFVCLTVMLMSSSMTVVYLQKHMKRMEESNSTLSALRKNQQMRVTVVGIIQTVLFFFASGYLMTEELIVYFIDFFDRHGHLASTVMGLYSFGASILLGVSQLKFRLMAKEIVGKLQTLKCPFPLVVT